MKELYEQRKAEVDQANDQLIELYRKACSDDDITIAVHPPEKEGMQGDLFIMIGEQEFNWTQISTLANFAAIELSADDLDLFSEFYTRTDGDNTPWWCNLQREKEAAYRDELYKHHGQAELNPANEISLPEMMAINIYTGDFYRHMNHTLKANQETMEELRSFDEEGSALKAALISSIVACSGLNKLPPSTDSKKVYRVSVHNNEYQKALHERAIAQNGIINFKGFVSTSIDEKYPKKSWQDGSKFYYEIENPVGLFIGPISSKDTTTKSGELESEYLMPPCQLQLLSSDTNDRGQTVIKARVVFDKASLARGLRQDLMEQENTARKSIEENMENESIGIFKQLTVFNDPKIFKALSAITDKTERDELASKGALLCYVAGASVSLLQELRNTDKEKYTLLTSHNGSEKAYNAGTQFSELVQLSTSELRQVCQELDDIIDGSQAKYLQVIEQAIEHHHKNSQLENSSNNSTEVSQQAPLPEPKFSSNTAVMTPTIPSPQPTSADRANELKKLFFETHKTYKDAQYFQFARKTGIDPEMSWTQIIEHARGNSHKNVGISFFNRYRGNRSMEVLKMMQIIDNNGNITNDEILKILESEEQAQPSKSVK